MRNEALRSAPADVTAHLIRRGEPVDPALVYFSLRAAHGGMSTSLAWLRERLFVGTGARHPDRVVMRFFELG